MSLSSEQAARFYRIWWPLLRYVNAQRQIVPELLERPEKDAIGVEQAMPIREALWASEDLREAFMEKNPANLTPDDLALVASWRDRIEDEFFILRHLKHHTVFFADKRPPQAYAVHGLVSPIEDVVDWPLPVLVKAVLLPFEDKIIYDSLLAPYAIQFGSGIRRDLTQAYRSVQERAGVLTTLRPLSEDEQRARSRAGNQKILMAFRKDLAASSLSAKMVEQHTTTIAAFAESELASYVSSGSLLDIDAQCLKRYLAGQGKHMNLVSLKRFVRFLLTSGRTDWEQAQAMQDLLKQTQDKRR